MNRTLCSLVPVVFAAVLLGPSAAARPPQELTPLAEIASEARIADLRLRAEVDGAHAVLDILRADIARLESATSITAGVNDKAAYEAALKALYKVKAELAGGDGESLTPEQVESSVQAIVSRAFRTGDTARVDGFGTSIAIEVEALVRGVATPPEILNYPAAKPIEWLLGANPLAGIAAAEDLIARPGNGWLEAVAECDPFASLVASQLLKEDGTPQPAAYALYQRIASSAVVSPTNRARATSMWMHRGADTPFVRESALRHAHMIRVRYDLAPWWPELLLQQQAPELRLLGLRTLLAGNPDAARLAQFANETDVELLQAVALHLGTQRGRSVAKAQPEVVAELWSNLLRNSDARVRKTTYASLEELVTSRSVFWLSFSAYSVLLEVLEEDSEKELAGSLYKRLPRLSAIAREGPKIQDLTPEILAVLVGRLRSPDPNIVSGVLTTLRGPMTDPEVAALVAAGIDWSRDSMVSRMSDKNFDSLSKLDPDAQAALFVRLAEQPETPKSILAASIGNAWRQNQLSLDGLSAERAVAAILAASRRVEPSLAHAMLFARDWTAGGDDLRTIATATKTGDAERAVCLLALARTEATDDAWRLALVAAAANVSEHDVDRTLASTLISMSSRVLSDRSTESLALFEALLADPRVPTDDLGGFGELPIAKAEDSKRAAGILDAMVARLATAASPERRYFGALATPVLDAMAQDVTLFRPSLLRNYGKGSQQVAACARVAKAVGTAESQEAIDAIRKAKWDALFGSRSTYETENLLQQLVDLGADDAVPVLLDYAQNGKFEKYREQALETVDNMYRIRELRERHAAPSVPTRASAAAAMAALMDDRVEAMRVEGIRGLATLGAVEYLPQLAERLRSGSDAERAAAREALDLLHAAAGAARSK